MLDQGFQFGLGGYPFRCLFTHRSGKAALRDFHKGGLGNIVPDGFGRLLQLQRQGVHIGQALFAQLVQGHLGAL